MKVGVLRVYFRIQDAGSLKEKRMVVKSLKGRVASRFNVSVAEIGSQDKWQLGELGVAAVGTDTRFVNSVVDNVKNFLTHDHRISIIETAVDII